MGKDTCPRTPLIAQVWKKQSQSQRADQWWPGSGVVGGGWGATAHRSEVSIRGDKNVLKRTTVMTAQLCEYTQHPDLCTLNG